MGGGNGRRSLYEILSRRLESCKSRYSTVDEIVNHLRANYPDYQRTKQQTLTRFVQEALESCKRGNKQLSRKPDAPMLKPDSSEEDEEEDARSASRKRRKKADESEERLKNMESLHLQRVQRDRSRCLSTTSASTSSPSSSEESDDEDGTVSTSEDAIYEEKVEPAFDLTKTMLRASYSGTKNVKSTAEEKNVELEVTNNNKATKIDAVDGVGGNMKDDLERKRQVRGSVSKGNGDVEVKGKGGPRFKDLGGMQKVLEKLKKEVIVPLYHPQFPRKLGVRPKAGILLHGPPGCGKTTLALATANESGFPFYQISATEVVSGVSGAFEENIRELFAKAYRTARQLSLLMRLMQLLQKERICNLRWRNEL